MTLYEATHLTRPSSWDLYEDEEDSYDGCEPGDEWIFIDQETGEEQPQQEGAPL